MSSRKSSTKRKRKQEGDSTEEESAAAPAEYTVFGGWLDEGFAGDDGVTEHEGFSLTLKGKTFEISLGDAVLMRSTDDDRATETQDSVTTKDPSVNGANANGHGMIARVERIWEINHKSRGGECPFMFQARWFLRVSFSRCIWCHAKCSSTHCGSQMLPMHPHSRKCRNKISRHFEAISPYRRGI